ncbi:hypothetical protein ACLB1M_30025 [Escherichia coli]
MALSPASFLAYLGAIYDFPVADDFYPLRRLAQKSESAVYLPPAVI